MCNAGAAPRGAPLAGGAYFAAVRAGRQEWRFELPCGMTAPAFPYLHHDFGVEILDIDLQDDQSEAAWQSLRDALAQHSLLVLRKQKLTREAMQRAALAFGAWHGEVQRLETRGPSERQEWHCTTGDDASPAVATVLCAREAPTQDGGMDFFSTHAPSSAQGKEIPRGARPEALEIEPERVYHHDFRPDDVLIWDNAALMHRACGLRPGERRVLEEISVHGERAAPPRAISRAATGRA
jgi:alpha-ketoglutarate-dependent taurine dioxygenase